MEGLSRIECACGDLTLERDDAIVNAANEALRGGGGVDGAIHRAAGPGLLAELVERYPDGCTTGQACLSWGHDLPARYVVHTVGPIWRGGGAGEAALLASCYRESVRVAAEAGARTVAFPAISCGVYRYPVEQAAAVAVRALAEALGSHEGVAARLVLFSEDLRAMFQRALDGERG